MYVIYILTFWINIMPLISGFKGNISLLNIEAACSTKPLLHTYQKTRHSLVRRQQSSRQNSAGNVSSSAEVRSLLTLEHKSVALTVNIVTAFSLYRKVRHKCKQWDFHENRKMGSAGYHFRGQNDGGLA